MCISTRNVCHVALQEGGAHVALNASWTRQTRALQEPRAREPISLDLTSRRHAARAAWGAQRGQRGARTGSGEVAVPPDGGGSVSANDLVSGVTHTHVCSPVAAMALPGKPRMARAYQLLMASVQRAERGRLEPWVTRVTHTHSLHTLHTHANSSRRVPGAHAVPAKPPQVLRDTVGAPGRRPGWIPTPRP